MHRLSHVTAANFRHSDEFGCEAGAGAAQLIRAAHDIVAAQYNSDYGVILPLILPIPFRRYCFPGRTQVSPLLHKDWLVGWRSC